MRENGMVHLNDKKGHCLFIASLIVINMINIEVHGNILRFPLTNLIHTNE